MEVYCGGFVVTSVGADAVVSGATKNVPKYAFNGFPDGSLTALVTAISTSAPGANGALGVNRIARFPDVTDTVPGTSTPLTESNIADGPVDGSSAESAKSVIDVLAFTPVPFGRWLTMFGLAVSNGAVVKVLAKPANAFPERSMSSLVATAIRAPPTELDPLPSLLYWRYQVRISRDSSWATR